MSAQIPTAARAEKRSQEVGPGRDAARSHAPQAAIGYPSSASGHDGCGGVARWSMGVAASDAGDRISSRPGARHGGTRQKGIYVVSEQLELQQALMSTLRERRPLVLLLGQAAWNSNAVPDPILQTASRHLGKEEAVAKGWPALLNSTSLPDNFLEWLAERFSRRPRPTWLTTIAQLPWSAVFTSSIDPELRSALISRQREPQAILTASEIPAAARSTARTPIYYLFGRAGISDAAAMPPRNRSELRQRSILQAIPMLNRLPDTATPLGLIVVDGFDPDRDWLNLDALLAVLEQSQSAYAIWFGWPAQNQRLRQETAELISSGRLIVSPSRLSALVADLEAEGKLADLVEPVSTERGTISFVDNNVFSPAPEMRIRVEAAAAIVDDSWLAFQAPLGPDAKYAAFRRFHGDIEGPRSLVGGIISGFAITRDFEDRLWQLTKAAINDHARFSEPIIVHGQSGTGKSIALARLARTAREDRRAAVLFATARIPQSTDIDAFCEAAEEAGATATLVICDSNASVNRYRDLFRGLRSRGRRIIMVGSSYRYVDSDTSARRTFVGSPDRLSDGERQQIAVLIGQFSGHEGQITVGSDRNVLAALYRSLPASRHRLSVGLGQEARSVEDILRERARELKPRTGHSKLAEQLVAAGLASETDSILDFQLSEELREASDSAQRLIDFVMAAGRLNCPIPINLLLRAITAESAQTDVTTVAQLFLGLDLFRWRRFENEGEEILISSRLVLEAELICRRRLINATGEGVQLVKLIRAARLTWDAGGAERRFLLDLVHNLGPDGPLGTRYRQSYLEAGRALTELRNNYGVNDPSLMLQEAVLRRTAIREETVGPAEQLSILEEARAAVQAGMDLLAGQSSRGARHTRSILSVERAAIYSFLATYRAQQSAPAQDIWSAYEAARTAARAAAAVTETYHALDISLWLPADLVDVRELSERQRLELFADIHSMLDRIDPTSLPPEQRERFNRRLFSLGEKLRLPALSEAAFLALEREGSTAGYYLRARSLGPLLDQDQSPEMAESDMSRATAASAFLRRYWTRIENDERCLRYLLECEWIAATGQRLLRGERAALPYSDATRRELLRLVKSLKASSENSDNNLSYLEAVLSWLNNEEQYANQLWRELARETDFIDPRRVVRRNILTDEAKKPLIFSGRIESAAESGRNTIRVDGLNRRIQLLARDFTDIDVAYGRAIPSFGIAFNYIGPIADPIRRASVQP
jgi:hypothetical protein